MYDILARICREDNYIIALYNRLDEFFPSSLYDTPFPAHCIFATLCHARPPLYFCNTLSRPSPTVFL
jgi:hypothetical protein